MKQSKLSRFTQEYPVEENTMKQIKLSRFIQEYPVGENIKFYFNSCKEVAEIIEKEFPNKSITFLVGFLILGGAIVLSRSIKRHLIPFFLSFL